MLLLCGGCCNWSVVVKGGNLNVMCSSFGVDGYDGVGDDVGSSGDDGMSVGIGGDGVDVSVGVSDGVGVVGVALGLMMAHGWTLMNSK